MDILNLLLKEVNKVCKYLFIDHIICHNPCQHVRVHCCFHMTVMLTVHARMHACTHTCTHACTHTHTHACTHTHIHTHAHTQHPCVHNIVEVLHIAEADIVVTIQEAVRQGSLKDIIHRTEGPQDSERDFDVSWSEKDMSIGSTLDVQQMALYGKQILKVLLASFPSHPHAVSIFPAQGDMSASSMYFFLPCAKHMREKCGGRAWL